MVNYVYKSISDCTEGILRLAEGVSRSCDVHPRSAAVSKRVTQNGPITFTPVLG